MDSVKCSPGRYCPDTKKEASASFFVSTDFMRSKSSYFGKCLYNILNSQNRRTKYRNTCQYDHNLRNAMILIWLTLVIVWWEFGNIADNLPNRTITIWLIVWRQFCALHHEVNSLLLSPRLCATGSEWPPRGLAMPFLAFDRSGWFRWTPR